MLIEVDGEQCVVDADCMTAGLTGTCVQGVCTSANAITCEGPDCPGGEPIACGGQLCENIVDPVCFDEQCASASAAAPFMCELPAPAMVDTVTMDLTIQEFVMRDVTLEELTVTACHTMDVLCDRPVATVQDEGMSGRVQLEVPRGFAGYLVIESKTTMPYILQFTRPIDGPIAPRTVRVGGYSTINALAQVTGAPVDLELGIIISEAYDCSGTPSGGIHFEEDSGGSLPFYLVDVRPSLEARETIYDPAAGYAVGGFFNVRPGLRLVTARLGEGGPVLARHNALVRAESMTFVDIRR